jgi:hypothetical protein
LWRFSLQAEAVLNQARGLRTLAGRAVEIEAREHDVIVTIAYGDERERGSGRYWHGR